MGGRLLAWLGVGRRAMLERQQFERQLRELRLATAVLKADMSILRHELEIASALAAERAAEAERLALLIPLMRNAFATAAQRQHIHLEYSPDVALLTPSPQVIDITRRSEVIDLEPAAAAGRSDSDLAGAASSDTRRTA